MMARWTAPFCSGDGRHAGLLYLAAGYRDTTAHRHQMLALSTVQTAVFDIPYLFRVATRQHLGYQAIIVRRLVTRMGVLKRVPVLGKDLLEDTPVPRGLCHHRVSPNWGDDLFAVQRFYHASSASSTPHQSSPGTLTHLFHPYVTGTSGTGKMKNPMR
jgi:hypothetical protein